jgi:hypothetical protein
MIRQHTLTGNHAATGYYTGFEALNAAYAAVDDILQTMS